MSKWVVDIHGDIEGDYDLVRKYEEPNKWIPLTERPMTEEEREEYEGIMILNCPLPKDGEEVLVSYGDYVCIDTFHDDDGCYFEDVEIDDVEAWMPKPLPYKAESEKA